MIIRTRLFWFFIGRDASVCGNPYGLWLLWRPRPEDAGSGRFEPIPGKWKFHIAGYSLKQRREYPLNFGRSPFITRIKS